MKRILSILNTKDFLIVFLLSLSLYILDIADLDFTILNERIQLSYAFPFSVFATLILSIYILFKYLQSGANPNTLSTDTLINTTSNRETSYIENMIEIKDNFNEIDKEELNDKIITHLHYKKIYDTTNKISNRVKREISDLRLRANVNLIIGGVITVGGLYFLGDTAEMMIKPDFLIHEIDGKNVSKEISEILLSYVPRVLLVIFIEIFAYFFLRLYKIGLDEIKYFQNELTNIESKLIAVEIALLQKDKEMLKSVLDMLLQTERNFILKKGETTVELERAKSESENMQNILKAVPEFFKNKGK